VTATKTAGSRPSRASETNESILRTLHGFRLSDHNPANTLYPVRPRPQSRAPYGLHAISAPRLHQSKSSWDPHSMESSDINLAPTRLIRGLRHPMAIGRELTEIFIGLRIQEVERFPRFAVFERQYLDIVSGFQIDCGVDDEPAVSGPLRRCPSSTCWRACPGCPELDESKPYGC
jgi:hypothetical protein